MKRKIATVLMLPAVIGVLYNVHLNAGEDGELKFDHSEYCFKAKAEGIIKAPTGYKSGNSVKNELVSEFRFDFVSDGVTGVISARFASNAIEKDEKAQVTLYPEPWDAPSEPPLYGFYWRAMEWPAYQKEIDLQYQTGAYHDSNGGYIDEQKKALRFFKYLMENARNRR